MDKEIFDLHINAGRKAGQERTCGKKVAYPTEESALRAAEAMNRKPTTRKKLEGYPCAFCQKWHIGREMSLEELREASREPV
jgi:hypothetical protein